MKTLLTLFLLVTFTVNGQEIDDLKINWNDYNQLIKSGEIEDAMTYMNPDIFEVLPKQQMIDLMKSIFETAGMEIQFKEQEITDFNDPMVISNKTYLLFDYYQVMDMKLESVAMEDTEMQSLMLSQFQKQFGDDMVSYDKDTNFFRIKAVKRALGMYNPEIGDWRFLTLEDGQRYLLEQFLDEEVIKYIYE